MKFLEPTRKLEFHLHWQFLGIWQVLWGIILESSHVYTTWDRRKSSAQSDRRDICGIGAIRSIPWSLTAICETFKISCLMGRHPPYEKRFGMHFNGPVIPFGAMVENHPISAKDISGLHQLGPKVLPGIFLGYVLYAGRIWKRDIMVADVEELEEMDASELHTRRLNAKEVLTPVKGETFIFPVADGTVKVSGGDQRLRTSNPSSRWLNTRRRGS